MSVARLLASSRSRTKSPPVSPFTDDEPYSNSADTYDTFTYASKNPPPAAAVLRDSAPSKPCPGFPYTTVGAFYLSDLLITSLVILALLSGLDAVPGISPSRFRQLAVLIVGSIVGAFFLFHLVVPLGALDGLLGALFAIVAFGAAGGAPLVLLPDFRDIVHYTTQPWLLFPHSLRVAQFLLLPLYDVGLIPLAFAGPAGWGGAFLGLTAPVVAFMFGVKHRNARLLGILWNICGAAEIISSTVCAALFLPGFVDLRAERGFTSKYLWHSAMLVVRFAGPVLLLLHAYSLWKLMSDRAPRPTTLWREDEDDDLANIYGADSPRAEEAMLETFRAASSASRVGNESHGGNHRAPDGGPSPEKTSTAKQLG